MPTMTKRAKANREIVAKINGPQPVPDAVKALKSFKAPKFDQTVDTPGIDCTCGEVRLGLNQRLLGSNCISEFVVRCGRIQRCNPG